MFVNETVKTYYQMFARQCGCWSAAHCMRKRGYTLEQCREALDAVRHCRRIWTGGWITRPPFVAGRIAGPGR